MGGTALVLMTLISGLPATAQQIDPCGDDFNKYCSGVTPGGGGLVRCYEANRAKMSADCVGWAEAAKAYAGTVKAACAEMVDARCSFAKDDPLAMVACLQSNYLDLSANCRIKLNNFKNNYPPPANAQ